MIVQNCNTNQHQGFERTQTQSWEIGPLLNQFSVMAALGLSWGRYLGFCLTIGLIVQLLMTVRSLPRRQFWGCSSSGREDLQTKGGSLKSITLFDHYPQLYLGSTTGSWQTLIGLVRKSGTFSGSTLIVRKLRKVLQLTQRQVQVSLRSQYYKADLSYRSLTRQNSKRAISQQPGSMAYSRVVRPTGAITFTSAPFSSRQRTMGTWFLRVATIRGVSPSSVMVLTLAEHSSTKKVAIFKSPLKQARQRGVILDFLVIDCSIISGYLAISFFIFSCSPLSRWYNMYSLAAQALFTAPIFLIFKIYRIAHHLISLFCVTG